MKFLIRFFVFLVFFWCVSVSVVSACTVGSIKCDGGKLYKCVCDRYLYGSCIYSDWDYYLSCTYGNCRSSTKCGQCNSGYNVKCVSGYRYYCSSAVVKSVKCTYGCYGTTCASCSSSTNSGCSSGKVCIDNKCYLPVDGVCGTANGGTYSVAPSGTSLCAAGDPSWVNGDQTGSDGTFNWTCRGKYTGDNISCSASKVACGSWQSFYGCLTSSACSNVNGQIRTDCYCSNGGVGCFLKTCSQLGGRCTTSGYCDAIGGRNSYPPSVPSDCRSSSTGMCCLGGGYTNECSSDSDCISSSGSCYRCDSVEIENTGYFYKKCVKHIIDGSCGSSDGDSDCSRPTSGLCNSGSVVWDDSTGSDGYWNWRCVSNCGGDSDVCSTRNLPTTNGVCGEANGGIFFGQPGGDLCTSGTESWVGGDEDAVDGTYNWSCTGKCGGTNSTCSSINDISPNLDSLVLENMSGTEVGPEEGGGDGSEDYVGRNHICQEDFGQSAVTRWVVTATDPQGTDDIGNIVLRFRSDLGNITTTDPIVSVNGVASFVVDTKTIPVGIYNVEVQINDKDDTLNTGEWVDTGRDFRIWDCLVSVSGTFYDGSGQTVSCSAGSGYTNTIPSAATFSMAYYLGSGAPRNMNVTSPNFASGDKLYWNTSVAYQPVFTDFPGADPTEMRINGSTCVSGISLDPKAYVDPYVDNPSMTIDYSSVLDQDAWFSVTSGSVISKAKISNYIPVTCNTENCQTSVGGVVWSKGRSTLSTYDQVSNQRRMNEKSLELKDVSYRYFFDNYFSKLGIGVTVGSSKNWSEIASLTGILLIKGNLLIDQNITGTEMRVIGVSGDITIDPSVKQINAVLFGRNVSVGGTSSDQLQINGSIYSSGSVTLNRSFTDKSKNNITPAVKVNYDPSILFKMPKEVSKSVTQWRMN